LHAFARPHNAFSLRSEARPPPARQFFGNFIKMRKEVRGTPRKRGPAVAARDAPCREPARLQPSSARRYAAKRPPRAVPLVVPPIGGTASSRGVRAEGVATAPRRGCSMPRVERQPSRISPLEGGAAARTHAAAAAACPPLTCAVARVVRPSTKPWRDRAREAGSIRKPQAPRPLGGGRPSGNAKRRRRRRPAAPRGIR
jgi:hypothetical protein